MAISTQAQPQFEKLSVLFGLKLPDQAVYPVQPRQVMTPAINPGYKFRLDLLRITLLWLGNDVSRNLYLSGPTGAGKTTLVEQVCARIGKPVFRVGCHARLEMADLIGRLTITESGSTVFVPGAAPQAMKSGGVLLLDEVDQLAPSTAMGVNAILDGEPLYIPETGEWVHPDEAFRVAATGNSTGRGDETGLYRGVQRQNLAWLDRFIHLQVGYLSQEEEEGILATLLPELPENIAKPMARLAAEVRQAFVGVSSEGNLETTLSTRTLVKWGAMTVSLFGANGVDPIMEGLNIALLYSAPAHEADAIRKIWQRIEGEGS